MTPAEIDVAVKLVQALLTAPTVVVVLVILIFPWLILAWSGSRQERRFEGVIKMYENNVQLVKDYQDLVEGYRKILDGQQDLIIHVTQVMTAVHDAVRYNEFCPQLRKENRR